MTATAEPQQERKRNHWRWSGYLTGAFFLVLLSLPTGNDRDEGAAYAAGYVAGRVVFVLAIAVLLRLAYVKLIRRDGRPVISPWIFAIAIPIALLALAGRAGG